MLLKVLTVMLLPATAAMLLAIAPSVSAAKEHPLRLSATISLADLDLSTDAGQRAARDRIRRLAQRLCDELGESPTPGIYDFADCVSGASRDALRRIAIIARQSPERQTASNESR